MSKDELTPLQAARKARNDSLESAERKLAAFPKLVAALKKQEWNGAVQDGGLVYYPACPSCHVRQAKGYHEEWCNLSAAIALAEEAGA